MKESANDPDLTHKRLVQLDAEHRALDERIAELEAQDAGVSLDIKRLKKQKLVLKDQITQLKAYLTPDIIA